MAWTADHTWVHQFRVIAMAKKNAAKKIASKAGNLTKDLARLTKDNVLVGVPSSHDARNGDSGINNATLAYIHDNGSPARNIPARPFMKPGINAVQKEITKLLRGGALDVLSGQSGAAEKCLHKVGLTAVSSIKNTINDGIGPPLKWGTVKGRLRNRIAAKGAKAALEKGGDKPSMADAKPLVATGQMRNSITYVIRDKKK